MANVVLSSMNGDSIVPCSDESSDSLVVPIPDMSKHLSTTGSLALPHSSTVSPSEMTNPSAFEPIDSTALLENLDGQNTGNVSADANKIVVITTNNHGHRKYDKKNFCFECKRPQSKLARHLKAVHNDEPSVQELLREKEESKKQLLLTKL